MNVGKNRLLHCVAIVGLTATMSVCAPSGVELLSTTILNFITLLLAMIALLIQDS